MIDVVVPIIVGLITFGGVSLSVIFTVKSNQTQHRMNLDAEHKNKILVLELQLEQIEHERFLKRIEIVSKSKLKLQDDMRNNLKDFVYHSTNLRNSDKDSRDIAVNKVQESFSRMMSLELLIRISLDKEKVEDFKLESALKKCTSKVTEYLNILVNEREEGIQNPDREQTRDQLQQSIEDLIESASSYFETKWVKVNEELKKCQ